MADWGILYVAGPEFRSQENLQDQALQDRLAAADQAFEWTDILQDLEALEEVEVTHADERFCLRTQAKGTCGAVFQAVGVALPSTVRQLEATA